MTTPGPVPPEYRGRDKMSLEEFIADVESVHFRTRHDTGANHNALFVWNILRNWAGMESLTQEDLDRNCANILNRPYEEIKAEADEYDSWKSASRISYGR